MKILRDFIQSVLKEDYNYINEINDDLKSQIEVIYKDFNLICLVPKTQKASKIYGKDTKWCQTTSVGFNMWAKTGLLIRFIFKDGTKIRFTYFFDKKKSQYDFYWSPATGQHLFYGDGNPFDFSQFDDSKYNAEKRLGKIIINKIKEIPKECQDKVLKFIEDHKEQFDYCLDSYIDYKPHKEIEKEKQYNEKEQLIRDWMKSDEQFQTLYIKVNNKSRNLNLPYYVTPIFVKEKDNNLRFSFSYSLEDKKMIDIYLDDFEFTKKQYIKLLNYINEKISEFEYKIKSSKKMVAENDEYQGEHSAPSKSDDGSYGQIHDLTSMYGGEDIYTNKAYKYFGNNDPLAHKAINLIQSVRNKPNALIKVYRAIPNFNAEIDKKVKNLNNILFYHHKFGFFPMKNSIIYTLEDKYNNLEYDEQQKAVYKDIENQIENLIAKKSKLPKINNGDWVTTIREYAVDHGKNELNNSYKILSKTVRAKELYNSGDSVLEYGYSV